MKTIKLSLISILVSVGSYASATDDRSALHTENNEIVCQMNDLLETKLFIDSDAELDESIGVLSSKVLEKPTKNAYAYNNRLFQVELVKVYRAKCLGCQDTQEILYRSQDNRSIINKLEVTESSAKLTRNVDEFGVPKMPSFVDEGICEANEPE